MTDVTKSDIKEFRYSIDKYSFSFSNLGLSLLSLCVPDKNGRVVDIIYSSDKNNVNGLINSGNEGFSSKLWHTKKQRDGYSCYLETDINQNSISGNLSIEVRFSLTSSGVFSIHYRAESTADCITHFSNHALFNLSGDLLSNVSDCVFNYDSFSTPSERLIDVHNLPESDDVCIINREFDEKCGFKKFCSIFSEKTGIKMCCYTDMPAFKISFVNNDRNFFNIETGYDTYIAGNQGVLPVAVRAGEILESTTAFFFSHIS